MADFSEQLVLEFKPLPHDPAQWPEARGFERLYCRDPHTQSRFVKALLGFESMAEMRHNPVAAQAARTVLNYFVEIFPECLTSSTAEEQDSDIFRADYEPEQRMLWLIDSALREEL